jgi:hypothetical protein
MKYKQKKGLLDRFIRLSLSFCRVVQQKCYLYNGMCLSVVSLNDEHLCHL